MTKVPNRERIRWLNKVIAGANHTNVDMAMAIGTSSGMISKLRTDARPISDRVIYRIVDVYNVDPPVGMEKPIRVSEVRPASPKTEAKMRRDIDVLQKQVAELTKQLKAILDHGQTPAAKQRRVAD